MSWEYPELQEFPAEAYLEPSNFQTEHDCTAPGSRPAAYAVEQYQKGLRISKEAKRVTIGVDSVWGCLRRDGGMTRSYEGIGYHAGTCALLTGFLQGPAELVVYRWGPTGITEHIIKEAACG